MKICMIGLGSIGKRHLKNLVLVLEKRKIKYWIDALRSSNAELENEYNCIINHQYFQAKELPNDYDIIFVTNPTSLHFDTLVNIIDKTKHVFIEKPIFESTNYDIHKLPLKHDSIYYVACPLRHKNIMKYIKQTIIEREKIISVRIISSSYLPEWRKGVDYKKVYSAKKSLGGGVTRDLIHEWDYAVYLFGFPDKVMHMEGHLSALEIDSDDLSVYIARYEDMLLEMHLDYVGQKTERILQLFTNDKRIDADLLNNIIYEYKNDKLVYKREFSDENFYLNEIEYLLGCIEKKWENMNTIEEAYRILRIALEGE